MIISNLNLLKNWKVVRKIVALFILFLNTISFAQEKNNSYGDSITKYFYSDATKAKKYSHQLLKSIDQSNDQSKQTISKKVFIFCYLADFSSLLNEKDSVFYFFDKALFEAKKANFMDLEIIVNTNKGNYFSNQYDYDSALNIYNQTIDLAKKTNDESTLAYLYLKKANIFYEIENYTSALKILKESIKNPNLQDQQKQLNIKLWLARVYIKLKKPELALKYIKPSILESKNSNLKEYTAYFQEVLGQYYIDKNKYTVASEVLKVAYETAKKTTNNNIIYSIAIEQAKVFTLLHQDTSSISIIKPLIEKENNKIPKELESEIYYILGENYKNINEMEKSADFYSKFIESSKKIGQKKINTIDNLNKIKIAEIEKREAFQISQKKILIIVLFVLLLLVIGILIKKKKDEKEDQQKFELLLDKIKAFENENLVSNKLKQENKINDDVSKQEIAKKIELSDEKDKQEIDDVDVDVDDSNESFNDQNIIEENEHSLGFNIKDETINEILEKLLKLEEKREFLKQDFTLHRVAKKLKTNTAYLSKIINTELDKTFSTYVNELRINYIILELKNNAKLRSYSIKAIAEEIGYKSPESFTKYFKIATGISPSVYIKKINKM